MSGRPSSSNVHLGLVLGITAAGVVLALGGCAINTPAAGAGSASPERAQTDEQGWAQAELDARFSEDERDRILAVQAIVTEVASEHALDPSLLNGIIWVESRFNPKAKSPAGARGLMQLMPSTAAYLAKRLGVQSARSYDPDFNVRAGALYLAEMIERFGDEGHAIAAYHAGPGNVKKWLAAGESFPEYSQTYVSKVMEARDRFPDGAVMIASDSEPMVVPDVDTLPDAADIHGVPRVIYEDTTPVAKQPPPAQNFDVVFEPHPELDRAPSAGPNGWRTSAPARRSAVIQPVVIPRETEPERKPEPEPKPGAKPKPKQAEPVGIGLLPDL